MIALRGTLYRPPGQVGRGLWRLLWASALPVAFLLAPSLQFLPNADTAMPTSSRLTAAPAERLPEEKAEAKPEQKRRAEDETPRAEIPPGKLRNKTGVDADEAMLWALLPGGGQFALGNYEAGISQAVLFLTAVGLTRHYTHSPDYIPDKERAVEFDTLNIYLAQELQRRELLYRDLPVFNETPYDRLLRMTRDGRTVEINPLLEYGPYDRLSVATVNAEMAAQTAQHVLLYSVYSTYRDLGRAPGPEDGYFDLASSPFRFKYISDPYIFLPILLLLASSAGDSGGGRTTLVPPGMKSGHGDLYANVVSFNAGVSEEAFFRGVLNTSFSRSFGPMTGGFLSGLIFGLAHYDGSISSVGFPTLAGFYFAYVSFLNGYDIRPGIALHFWWDVIVISLEVRQWKEDRRVGLKPQEVHYMPTLFQYRF